MKHQNLSGAQVFAVAEVWLTAVDYDHHHRCCAELGVRSSHGNVQGWSTHPLRSACIETCLWNESDPVALLRPLCQESGRSGRLVVRCWMERVDVPSVVRIKSIQFALSANPPQCYSIHVILLLLGVTPS
jgi:hypothetical protein